MIHNAQLTFAREYRGLTQTELARRVSGLSQSNLSRFEKGFPTLSAEVLERTMAELGFPVSFLEVEISENATSEHYRKQASMTASERSRISRMTRLAAYEIDRILDEMEAPPFKFRELDLDAEGLSPAEAAKYIRRAMRLGDHPLRDICHALESRGVFVYEWNCPVKGFDGVSLITDAGYRLIIVDSEAPADRKRFTLVHELGHLLMHACPDILVLPSRDKEAEANEFASELLFPFDAARRMLTGLRVSDLPELKRIWLVSMQMIVRRALGVGGIDAARYKYLMVEMSRRHWRTREPVEVEIDAPEVIPQAFRLAREELGYTAEEMAEWMHLPEDAVREVVFPFKRSGAVFVPV